ncbi:MAG TPA: hypothetical protein VF112_05230, partial [Candidatus Dormibacteraeota bacterium]
MRNRAPRRPLAAVALTLLLAGCGSPAAPAARATQTPTGSAPAATSPSASASAAPTPTPKPAPPALIAVTSQASTKTGATTTIRLVGLDGTTVASTSVPSASISGWPKAGPDGAYWLDSAGTLLRLGRDGAVTSVATIPAGSFFAVGPGGRIAYETSSVQSPAGGTPASPDNRLYVLASGAANLVAERSSKGTADGGANAPGIPPYDWYYDPMTWTDEGLLIARLPQGGCGCGSFGMESVQTYTGVVDTASGVAGSVTGDQSCPVSGIAADGTEACFHTPEVRTNKDEGLGADAIRILQNGRMTQTFSLSTQTAGGDAVFSPDAGELAYATSPAGLDCGAWEGQTTLRVLNLVTGSARPLGPLGLQPIAWVPDGRILASRSTGDGTRPNGLQTGALIVDPVSGTVQAVPSTQSDSTQVL